MKHTRHAVLDHMNRTGKDHVHLSDRDIMICADPEIQGVEKTRLLKQCALCPSCTDRVLAVVRAQKARAGKTATSAAFEKAVFAVKKKDFERRKWHRTVFASAASVAVIAGAAILYMKSSLAQKDPLQMQISDNKAVVKEMASASAAQKSSPKHSSLKKPAASAGYSFFLLKNGASYSKSIEESVAAGISAPTHTVNSTAHLKDQDIESIMRTVDTLPKETQNEFRDGYLTGLLSHAVKSGTFDGERKKELIELMINSSSEEYRALGKRMKEGDASAMEDLTRLLSKNLQ